MTQLLLPSPPPSILCEPQDQMMVRRVGRLNTLQRELDALTLVGSRSHVWSTISTGKHSAVGEVALLPSVCSDPNLNADQRTAVSTALYGLCAGQVTPVAARADPFGEVKAGHEATEAADDDTGDGTVESCENTAQTFGNEDNETEEADAEEEHSDGDYSISEGDLAGRIPPFALIQGPPGTPRP
jgi:hypothetical protein